MGGGSAKDDRSSISDQAFHCSASSVESLPSASGSSEFEIIEIPFLRSYLTQFFFASPKGTQALVRSGSPNSSLSADDRATIVPICRARAIVDSAPFPYEKDALKFKVCWKLFFPLSCFQFFNFFPFLPRTRRKVI